MHTSEVIKTYKFRPYKMPRILLSYIIDKNRSNHSNIMLTHNVVVSTGRKCTMLYVYIRRQ